MSIELDKYMIIISIDMERNAKYFVEREFSYESFSKIYRDKIETMGKK